MAARKKRLIDFVRDRTFLARRHAPLLASAPLLYDPVLRHLQEQYRAAESAEARREWALHFQRLLRNPQERFLWQPVPDLPEVSLPVSDLSDVEIPEGTGALVRVIYEDERKGVWELRVTDEEAASLVAKSWPVGD